MFASSTPFGQSILDVNYDVDTSADHSLQELCAIKIASDSYLIRNSLHLFPNKVKDIIMQKALYYGRFPAVAFLIKNWPYSELKFPRLLPVSRSRESSDSVSKVVHLLHKSSVVLINNFFESIKGNNANSQLRILDLSSMLINSDTVRMLCSHIFNVNSSSLLLNMTGKYSIRVNCTLNDIGALKMLHSTLLEQGREPGVVELVVCGLKFTNCIIHFSNATKIFAVLNPKDLQLLSLDFCQLFDVAIREILVILPSFHNLKALDLIFLTVPGNDQLQFRGLLYSALEQLVHITHLNFINLELGNSLVLMLNSLNKGCIETAELDVPAVANKKLKVSCSYPSCEMNSIGKLVHLNLIGCSLSSVDLEYLARSDHTQTLKNLNLRSNLLGSHFRSFLLLLKAVSPSLCVLEIENCSFREQQMAELFAALLAMKNLQYLNMSFLVTSSESYVLHMPTLCQLPCLRDLCISLPPTVDRLDNANFKTFLEDKITNQRADLRILWK